ncbi:MAG: SPOR domain-containing protein [Acidobacteriota bacterium]|nr:SPOR domain-containing protein [Acidobacteriota bacterium]
MSDEQFREIQLNGKQLVFLFMAATVVSVVIFLCGVLVGRGVRAQTEATADAAVTTAPGPGAPPGSMAQAATPDVPVTEPVAPVKDAGQQLTYYDRLEARKPAAETLKSPAAAPAAPPAAQASTPAQAKPAAPPAQAPAVQAKAAPLVPRALPQPAPPAHTADAVAAELTPPAGPGYAVQVAALRDRREAESVARRLLHKGYKAYVVSPVGGRPAVFRVRVGKFKTRREAQIVATRLRKEEKFKPWITR